MLNASPDLGPGPDPAARSAPLRRAHERFVHSGEAAGVRTVVADSWRRCRDGGVDPGRTVAPVQLDGAELRSHRERSPLVELLPLFRELLGRIATEARHLMAVGDADATAALGRGASGVAAPGRAHELRRGRGVGRAGGRAPTHRAPPSPWRARCRSPRPSTSARSCSPGRVPRRPSATRTRATCWVSSTSPGATSWARRSACPWCGPPRWLPRVSWPGCGRPDRRAHRRPPPVPPRPVWLTWNSWDRTRRSSVSACSSCGCPAGTARSSRCSPRTRTG